MSKIANFPYPKGSLWRRWDLQVQTIYDDNYTPLGDYYEDIKSASPDEWQEFTTAVGGEDNALKFDSKGYFNDESIDKSERCLNYVRTFFAYIDTFTPNLDCIAITDHNYFDDMLLDTFVRYAEKAQCKIIPGVEINCQGVHMLLLFQNPPYEKPSFSAGIQALLDKCDIHNKNNAGGTLTTTSKDIKEIITKVNTHNGMVIYSHCNSDNGLFQERSKTDRTYLAEIFNYQRINLLQARNMTSCNSVAEYIGATNSLTSEFSAHISSDARSLQEIGAPDSDGNYLWIKANPNFDGLKQILYEPKQRIFIGKQVPETKKPYFLVSSVRFLDNTDDIKFSSKPIEISQNLTTIIGGKSTGKSLLLHYMAKTIDPNEVRERVTKSGIQTTYELDTSADFNFEVTWGDGQKTLLKAEESKDNDGSQARKILFIPQKYLNTLSEGNIRTKSALNDFVRNVILQDKDIKSIYEDTIENIRTDMKSIPKQLGELITENKKIETTEEELKQLGNEKGIKVYIGTLQTQIDEIKSKSGLSDEQLQKYEALTSRDKVVGTSISNLNEDKKTTRSTGVAIQSELDSIQNIVSENVAFINESDVKSKYRSELGFIDDMPKKAKAAVTSIINMIDEKVNLFEKERLQIKADLAPLLAKVKLQEQLQEKMDEIEGEQAKLNDIGIKKKSLSNAKTSCKKKAGAILDKYKQVFSRYDKLRNEFKKFESSFGDIALGVHVGFRETDFNDSVVSEFLNKHDLKRVFKDADWLKEYFYKYDTANHIASVQMFFDGLLSGNINTIKGRPARDALTKLLEDYFYLDFRIFYKNDALDKMSPGKKGLVLLRLLINLSDEEWPILLDQPEDDLDNRSVYEDLVKYLKEKKTERQIIVVTHNPNLVVGADAEEVIVANQSGQEIGRDNKSFRFEYVSEALENTFELDESQETAILLRKGIRQHVCEILEGGQEAFQQRERKYNFPQSP